MVQIISSLNYEAIAPNANKGIATIVLDPTIDLVWNVKLLGSVQGSSENVIPQYCSVDNIKGAVSIATKLGPFIYQTPPFYRETTILISNGIQEATFTFDPGATLPVTVYISEERIANDATNQLAVQVTAAKTLVYNYVTYTATTNQQIVDGNTNVKFVPIIAPINYNLLNIAGVPVDNGFMQFVKNTGSFSVTLLPFGAQTINAGSLPNMPGFNAANPLVLQPGDGGILTSDGTNWFFEGHVSFDTPEITFANAIASTGAHTLGKSPNTISLYMRCKVAEIGYSVGDEIYLGSNNIDITGNKHVIAIIIDGSTWRFVTNNNTTATPLLVNKAGGGGDIFITLANWRMFLRLNALWL